METTKVRLKIWEKRSEKGMSARELAELIGISVGALHYYETNQHSPTVDLVYDMAVVMGVDFYEMFEKPDTNQK